MRAASVALSITLALSGLSCAGGGQPALAELEAEAASSAAPELVRAHLEQAAAQTADAAAFPPAGPSPGELERDLASARRRAEELLRDRPALVSFRDFTSPESRALGALARDETALRQALAEGLDLGRLGALVFARDPRIAASAEVLESTVSRFSQVAYGETLLAQYRSFLAPLVSVDGTPLHGDPVARHFPPPGVLALKSELVARDVDLARHAFEETVRDRVLAAESTLLRLWYLAEEADFAREMIRYLGQLEETISSRVATARAHKSQVLRVQVESAALRDGVRTLEEEMQATRARLAEFLDLGGEVVIGTPGLPADLPPAPEDLASLEARARRDRIEVRIARDRVRRVETAIALAEKMSQPDWTLGLGYFRGIRAADRPEGAEGVLPEDFGPPPPAAQRFWYGQRDAYLREARGRREALAKAHQAEQRHSEYLVERESFALSTADRKLRLHRDVLIPQARQAYEDTLAAYQSERATFPEVIDALRQWLSYDVQMDAARRDYLMAWLGLEAAVGGALSR
jgi:outer membrane protein TolC